MQKYILWSNKECSIENKISLFTLPWLNITVLSKYEIDWIGYKNIRNEIKYCIWLKSESVNQYISQWSQRTVIDWEDRIVYKRISQSNKEQ